MNRALQIRLDRGLSRSDVVDATGVSFRTLRRVEDHRPADTFILKAETLRALGDFYEVPASSLLMPAIDEATAA